MDYTVVFIVMAIVFLVAIGINCSDIVKIREEITTIREIDLKLMQKIHDSQCTMDQGWKDAINGWRKTLAVSDELLEELKRAIERRE